MYTDLYFSLQYQAKGEGEAEGTTYFLPPGISMDDKDSVISSPTQNESNTSSAQNVNNKEEDEEDDGPWDCPSCGYTNTTSKARCTNILRDNTGDGRQDKCMAWREGKRKKYFKKIKDVLQRVLEKKNEAESMAADAFLELIPDGADIFLSNQKRDKGSGDPSLSPTPDKRYTDAYNPHSPDRLTPRQHHSIHFGWKDEGRMHYEKTESKVGPEYQVDILPTAGSYATTDNTTDVNDGGAL